MRKELIEEAKKIIEEYQSPENTNARIQDALSKVRQEVLCTVRSAVSNQVEAIKAQQERDISQLMSNITSTINERLRAFKTEVAEYTNNDRGSAHDSSSSALEHQIQSTIQQLNSTNTIFRQQMSSLTAMIKKEKMDMSSKAAENITIQQQIDEEERKISHLQAEIAARERHLAEERAFLQSQTEAFLKEKRMSARSGPQSNRWGDDRSTEKALLKELQSIRRNLNANVVNEASSIVAMLRKEVEAIAAESDRMRNTRELMMRAMNPGFSYSRL